MTPEEIEHTVEDLEVRVERLRALYDQYFMGIEKVEPLVQRKDVDRRLWLLRREQIRNTGLRFKLQQIIQRYNTFGMYWQRILREIENGTYKRDLARAVKRFGSEPLTIVAKRRLGKQLDRVGENEEAAPSQAAPPDEDANESTLPFRREELPALEKTIAEEPSKPLAAPRPARPKVPHVTLDLDEDDELFAGLEIDRPPSRPEQSSSPEISVRLSSSPGLARPPAPPAPAGAIARPASSPSGFALPPAAPATAPGFRPESGTAPGRSGLPGSVPVAAKAGADAAKPAYRSSLAGSTSFGGAAARPNLAPPAARPPAASSPDDLSEARIRDIYAKLVDAKRKCNESTANVTSEGLAKTLRESASKLREKHAGKTVDFDVVIKDGKAVVKPILKG